MQTTIEKVKLLKGDKLTIGISRKLDDNTNVSSPGEDWDRKVHPDLLEKMKELEVHLALRCGYTTVKAVGKHPEECDIENFHVSGYSIGGKEGAEGVVITGHHLPPLGGAVILNSPFIRFEIEDEAKAYPFIDQLRNALDELEAEVKAYMDGSKVGADPQGVLEFAKEEE